MANVTQLKVNQAVHPIDADPQSSLLIVLREQLDLTGSKYGCGEGQCGACTVLVEGHARRACVTPVGAVVGKQITSIEGFDRSGQLHPLQQAFLDEDALQCGYCTSGMILSAASLLNEKHNPSDSEILQFMQGNVCRCGTYPRIAAGIRRAARGLQEFRG